ncbi:thioredoxin family protein [Mycoplasma phocoenae]|uniref:Thioredoxin family protein n=1 Tax=Mycoplasma phocoenae TaxID=754517 RepID=A0A858U5C3_9MOLU|nr:thioredoxin family protein [Mycoplasma phocoenae]QJG67251.1 thioredoxin family protein [Mycoplasma phocoenae]
MIKKLTDAKELETLKGKTFLIFSAPWCSSCTMIKPVVADLADKHPELTVITVEVDDFPELTRQYGVNSIPSYYVFEDNKVVNSGVGFNPLPQLEKLLLG